MPKTSQYQAYSLATRTVAKTRQVVMLYDGTIRFMKQARDAIVEHRIEDRFKFLVKASKVICGLQNSIDFENGGEVANTLHQFYMDMSVRILSINFNRENAQETCETLIEELKQMRDVWDNIDLTMGAGVNNTPNMTAALSTGDTSSLPAGITDANGNVTFSA